MLRIRFNRQIRHRIAHTTTTHTHVSTLTQPLQSQQNSKYSLTPHTTRNNSISTLIFKPSRLTPPPRSKHTSLALSHRSSELTSNTNKIPTHSHSSHTHSHLNSPNSSITQPQQHTQQRFNSNSPKSSRYLRKPPQFASTTPPPPPVPPKTTQPRSIYDQPLHPPVEPTPLQPEKTIFDLIPPPPPPEAELPKGASLSTPLSRSFDALGRKFSMGITLFDKYIIFGAIFIYSFLSISRTNRWDGINYLNQLMTLTPEEINTRLKHVDNYYHVNINMDEPNYMQFYHPMRIFRNLIQKLTFLPQFLRPIYISNVCHRLGLYGNDDSHDIGVTLQPDGTIKANKEIKFNGIFRTLDTLDKNDKSGFNDIKNTMKSDQHTLPSHLGFKLNEPIDCIITGHPDTIDQDIENIQQYCLRNAAIVAVYVKHLDQLLPIDSPTPTKSKIGQLRDKISLRLYDRPWSYEYTYLDSLYQLDINNIFMLQRTLVDYQEAFGDFFPYFCDLSKLFAYAKIHDVADPTIPSLVFEGGDKDNNKKEQKKKEKPVEKQSFWSELFAPPPPDPKSPADALLDVLLPPGEDDQIPLGWESHLDPHNHHFRPHFGKLYKITRQSVDLVNEVLYHIDRDMTLNNIDKTNSSKDNDHTRIEKQQKQELLQKQAYIQSTLPYIAKITTLRYELEGISNMLYNSQILSRSIENPLFSQRFYTIPANVKSAIIMELNQFRMQNKEFLDKRAEDAKKSQSLRENNNEWNIPDFYGGEFDNFDKDGKMKLIKSPFLRWISSFFRTPTQLEDLNYVWSVRSVNKSSDVAAQSPYNHYGLHQLSQNNIILNKIQKICDLHNIYWPFLPFDTFFLTHSGDNFEKKSSELLQIYRDDYITNTDKQYEHIGMLQQQREKERQRQQQQMKNLQRLQQQHQADNLPMNPNIFPAVHNNNNANSSQDNLDQDIYDIKYNALELTSSPIHSRFVQNLPIRPYNSKPHAIHTMKPSSVFLANLHYDVDAANNSKAVQAMKNNKGHLIDVDSIQPFELALTGLFNHGEITDDDNDGDDDDDDIDDNDIGNKNNKKSKDKQKKKGKNDIPEVEYKSKINTLVLPVSPSLTQYSSLLLRSLQNNTANIGRQGNKKQPYWQASPTSLYGPIGLENLLTMRSMPVMTEDDFVDICANIFDRHWDAEEKRLALASAGGVERYIRPSINDHRATPKGINNTVDIIEQQRQEMREKQKQASDQPKPTFFDYTPKDDAKRINAIGGISQGGGKGRM